LARGLRLHSPRTDGNVQRLVILSRQKISAPERQIHETASHHLRTMSSSGLIAIFRTIPKELFRVNNGRRITLREWSSERHVFDNITKDGRVKPKALQPSTYEGERAFWGAGTGYGTFTKRDQPRTVPRCGPTHRTSNTLSPGCSGAQM